MRDGVFVPVRKALGSLQKQSGQVPMPTYGWSGFVLVQETHWAEPFPASGYHTPGAGSEKGMGSGRVWPCVQPQPGKEMVEQGCGGEPRVWRVDRTVVADSTSQRIGGASNETCGDKLEDEALGGVPRTPAAACFSG